MATVYGTNNSETLNSLDGVTNGADTIYGYGGNDSIFGWGGNDIIVGGSGADDINGGAGSDYSSYNDSTAGVTVNLSNGTGFGGYAEGDALTSIENVTGSWYDDFLIGNDSNNVLAGLGGHDTLKGGGGADTLNGGDGDDYLNGMTGNDSMNGGNGADTFIVDSSSDTVIDTSSGTFDIVMSSANYALGANADIESLRTTDDAGFGSIDLTGNASSQEIRGNAGNNMIAGGLGNDILTGLFGEDAFIFNTALGAGNVDSITDYSVAQDQIRLDNATFTNLFATEGNWLTADEFRIGAAAADANDRIVYNSATGALFYDADGSGAGAAVQFATLTTGLALTSNEFFIV
jgi:Ca2+-binding RTX toxin-like protein